MKRKYLFFPTFFIALSSGFGLVSCSDSTGNSTNDSIDFRDQCINENTSFENVMKVATFIREIDPPTESGSIYFLNNDIHLWCSVDQRPTIGLTYDYYIPDSDYILETRFFCDSDDSIVTSVSHFQIQDTEIYSAYYYCQFKDHFLYKTEEFSNEGTLKENLMNTYNRYLSFTQITLISTITEVLMENNLPYIY